MAPTDSSNTETQAQATEPAQAPQTQEGNVPKAEAPPVADKPEAAAVPAGHEPAAQVTPPTVGRTVMFGVRTSRGVVERPATVVRNWPSSDGKPGILVNLCVHLDGSNDFDDGRMAQWATSVLPAAPGTAGAWWWPPRE